MSSYLTKLLVISSLIGPIYNTQASTNTNVSKFAQEIAEQIQKTVEKVPGFFNGTTPAYDKLKQEIVNIEKTAIKGTKNYASDEKELFGAKLDATQKTSPNSLQDDLYNEVIHGLVEVINGKDITKRLLFEIPENLEKKFSIVANLLSVFSRSDILAPIGIEDLTVDEKKELMVLFYDICTIWNSALPYLSKGALLDIRAKIAPMVHATNPRQADLSIIILKYIDNSMIDGALPPEKILSIINLWLRELAKVEITLDDVKKYSGEGAIMRLAHALKMTN